MKLKHSFVSILKRTAMLAVALGGFAVAPIAAQAGNQVPFRASWDAQISIAPLAPPLFAVSGLGAGRATHLGKMTAQSIAEVVNLATGEGAASYRFTAANGDKVFVNFVFTAIPVSDTDFVVQGVWQVTGGTGRFGNATGSGTYEGQVGFTGATSAVGHFALAGTISSPGSLK
jgi:hypothetical protein